MGECDNCEDEAVQICYDCNDTVCDNHGEECGNCGDLTCTNCGRTCPRCNEWRCADDNKCDSSRNCLMTRCGGCDTVVCGSCGSSDESSST